MATKPKRVMDAEDRLERTVSEVQAQHDPRFLFHVIAVDKRGTPGRAFAVSAPDAQMAIEKLERRSEGLRERGDEPLRSSSYAWQAVPFELDGDGVYEL